MKSVLIALLLVAIVLLVGSEARRLGGKGKPGGRPGGRPGGKPWLMSEFMSNVHQNAQTVKKEVCRACDEKFALKNITSRRFTKTKTICVPCWRLEESDSVYLEQCIECPRNCSDCQEGVCHACDEDFALTTRRFKKTKTFCVACGPKLKRKNRALYHDQCAECPRNCSDCQDGVCHACDEDFALKISPLLAVLKNHLRAVKAR
ncbi:hypothetical protein OS493_017409 [Desmophyllum pertusum]|uniref:Uncharacterized protein n=1 Tax=Desmophyllum pertusum TaxID=174260 RepID=A0A9X0A1K5_9CNID|nr:hypothetical protein OS493_017409 [Desmophyllum pertusum]